MNNRWKNTFANVWLCLLAFRLNGAEPTSQPPKAGDLAVDFNLKTLADQPVSLGKLTKDQSVVLIVLRGWPGYQCPLCTRQVKEFADLVKQFQNAKATVVMVYPGPASELKAHAKEFLASKAWPPEFVFLIDPDYSFTRAYGLRWDAPKETAYPSTFIIDTNRKVRFAVVSKSHGGRTKAADVLKELAQLKP